MKGVIQSVIFSKDNWTLDNSKKWLKRRKRKYKNISDVDETDTSYRYRQVEPSEFNKYRTNKKKNGISFILGYNKDDNVKEPIIDNSIEGSGLRDTSLKLFPYEFDWAKYPGEKHLPPIDGLSFNYFGPGSRLDIRLKDIDSGIYEPKVGEEPTCGVDNAAYIHDIRYTLAGDDLSKQNEADLEMVENLKQVKPKSSYEAFAKWLGIGIMSAKAKLGLGIDDDIMEKHGYGIETNEEFDKYGIDFNELAKKDGSL